MFALPAQSTKSFRIRLIAGLVSAAGLVSPALGTERSAAIPDLSGQWGRNMVFFEPPSSGPGPVANTIRKADGTMDVLHAQVGDYTNPILKPEAAEAVKERGELSLKGTVAPDLNNMCRPEPPPYVLGAQFGVRILQQRDKVTLLYVYNNLGRLVPLNVPHPEKLTPTWKGHSVGWYEGDTLVIDTIGIKVGPLSTVDLLGAPHSEALHVIERYRLIDGDAAAEAQRKHGSIATPFNPYGRGDIDPDTGKKGLQVEFTIEDAGVFTTPWSGLVTYRPVTGDWPEVVCAENTRFFGTDAGVPTADTPDF